MIEKIIIDVTMTKSGGGRKDHKEEMKPPAADHKTRNASRAQSAV